MKRLQNVTTRRVIHFGGSRKRKSQKLPEQTVRDIWVISSLSVGLAEIANEMAEVNQLSGLSP